MNINQLKDTIPIRTALRQNGIDIRGRNFKCVHVFHEDSSPSAMVSADGKGYFCNTCGYGGDILHLYQRGLSGGRLLSFKESVKQIEIDFNVKVDGNFDSNVAENHISKIYNIITSKENLKKGKDYLEKRGLRNPYSVGYMPLNLRFEDKKTQRAYNQLKGRIVFPIRDNKGVVVGFSGRTLSKLAKAKYINTDDYNKSNVLYGYNVAKQYTQQIGWMGFAEGYTDVIAAHQTRNLNIVGYCSASITTEQAEILRYDKAKFGVLLTDGDNASENALKKNITTLFQSGKYIKMFILPKGKDPCDFILENPRVNLLHESTEVWKKFSYTESWELIKKLSPLYREKAMSSMARTLDEDKHILEKMFINHLKKR